MRKVIAGILALLFAFQTTIVASGKRQSKSLMNAFFHLTEKMQINRFITRWTGAKITWFSSKFCTKRIDKINPRVAHNRVNPPLNGYILTNLFATWNKGQGSTVVFAAHYDTRHKADKIGMKAEEMSQSMVRTMALVSCSAIGTCENNSK